MKDNGFSRSIRELVQGLTLSALVKRKFALDFFFFFLSFLVSITDTIW